MGTIIGQNGLIVSGSAKKQEAPPKIEGFKTEWNIPSNGYLFTYPIKDLSPTDGDCTIDWGDGVITVIPANTDVASYRSHIYATAGDYVITLDSQSRSMPYFNNYDISVSKLLLLNVLTPFLEMKSGNTSSMYFSSCFTNCENLINIPEDLFRYNVNARYFSSCFQECINLSSIPENLFKYNVNATGFSYCFYKCINLSSIPENLFRCNMNALNFNYCFSECPNVQLNKNIFCNEETEMTTRFAGKTVNFSSCFRRTPATTSKGEAPRLWNYTYNKATSTACFRGDTAVSLINFSEIPTGWK